MSDPSLEKSPAKDVLETIHIVQELPSPPPTFTPAQERALYRKIDLRLMPVLSLMYFLASMDRANIGNAKIAGLTSQLNLVGNQFNLVVTISSIPYCIFELPANLILQKIRPSRWLPGITVAWGTILIVNGFVKTYPQLLVARIGLGTAEAGLFPGVMYYMTLWYPRHALQLRMGLFVSSVSFSLAFSGLLAFGIQYMDGMKGLEGWSWIFILEGTATVVVGIVAVLLLADNPETGAFLTPEEREFLAWRKKNDSSGVGEQQEFAMRYVWAAILDWQVWLHSLIFMSIIIPVTGISLFLPTIILGFGNSIAISQLLTVPMYFSATVLTLLFGYYSDKLRIRFPFVLAGLLLLLIGFAIEISAASLEAKYFGTILCVSGGFASLPGAVAWLANNLGGQCKRGIGMAVDLGIGSFGVLIAANLFRAQDAPRYIFANALEVMFVGIGFICVSLAVVLYMRINAQRDALARNTEQGGYGYSVDELREMGDRAPSFRYIL